MTFTLTFMLRINFQEFFCCPLGHKLKYFTLHIVLGIEFYLFVSHGGMNDRGSTCKCSRFSKFTCGSSVFHTSTWNKQVEFNPYIHTLSKLSRFRYEISVFKCTTGRYLEQQPEQPAHTPRLSLVGKMDVKIFLMFIVAENTGSVNILNSNFVLLIIVNVHILICQCWCCFFSALDAESEKIVQEALDNVVRGKYIMRICKVTSEYVHP